MAHLRHNAGTASTSRAAAHQPAPFMSRPWPARSTFTQRPRRGFVCAAAASKTFQLPIFPLNVVALPAATVPLMIFEARYRVLFNTLLDGDPGVEEGLVQKDSPFCGSRRFGMCYVDNKGNLASIGTVLEIMDFAHVKQDGRLFVTNKGKERFEIKKVVVDKPVLLCEVELLPHDEDDESKAGEVAALAKEVADLLRTTIKLNLKMNNINASEDQLEPEELADLSPYETSFYIASFFSDIKYLQQTLLEEGSTRRRLVREKEILADTVRYYSAAAALKSAFNSSGSEEPGASSSSSSTAAEPEQGSGGSSSTSSSASKKEGGDSPSTSSAQ